MKSLAAIFKAIFNKLTESKVFHSGVHPLNCGTVQKAFFDQLVTKSVGLPLVAFILLSRQKKLSC